jgi:hypothetical protein
VPQHCCNRNLGWTVPARCDANAPVFTAARAYVNEIWQGRPGRHYTTDYATYQDDSAWRRVLYRFMEASGLSTF